MIVNINDKSFQTRSDKPNSNWLDENWVVIPDNSHLAQKVENFFPRFDLIFDDDKNVIDVVEISKTEEELTQERIKEIDKELSDIDNEGVTRHLENQIEASGTLDTIYIATKQLIDKKNQLREERKTLAQKLNKGEM